MPSSKILKQFDKELEMRRTFRSHRRHCSRQDEKPIKAHVQQSSKTKSTRQTRSSSIKDNTMVGAKWAAEERQTIVNHVLAVFDQAGGQSWSILQAQLPNRRTCDIQRQYRRMIRAELLQMYVKR